MTDKPDDARVTKAMLAIHDHGTRDKATPKRVMDALVAEGFTREEIQEAIKRWNT